MSDIDLLIQELSHEELRVRIAAAKALGIIGDKSAVPALQNLLEDKSIAVVRSVTLAIGAIGGCEQLAILIPLTEHDDLWVQKAAVQALGLAQCPEAVPRLVNLLGDEQLDALAREALVALKVDPDFF